MEINAILKAVIVLLIVMILSLVAALIVMNNKDAASSDTEWQETSETVQGTDDSSDTTDKIDSDTSSDETSADGTSTSAEETTAAETTRNTPYNPPETTTAGTTSKPDDEPKEKAPKNFSLTKEFSTDTGVRLNMHLVCTAVEDNGRVKLTVEQYLDYHALFIGARSQNCYLTVGGNKETFKTEAINEESNASHSLLLCTNTQYFDYGEKVSISACFQPGCVYSDVKITTLPLECEITLR